MKIKLKNAIVEVSAVIPYGDVPEYDVEDERVSIVDIWLSPIKKVENSIAIYVNNDVEKYQGWQFINNISKEEVEKILKLFESGEVVDIEKMIEGVPAMELYGDFKESFTTFNCKPEVRKRVQDKFVNDLSDLLVYSMFDGFVDARFQDESLEAENECTGYPIGENTDTISILNSRNRFVSQITFSENEDEEVEDGLISTKLIGIECEPAEDTLVDELPF